MSVYFITQNEMSIRFMKKILKRLCTGFLALATVVIKTFFNNAGIAV